MSGYQPYTEGYGNQVSSKYVDANQMNDYYEALKQLDSNKSNGQQQYDGYGEEKSTTSTTLNRWPTLFEILNKKTLPPVDLWSFYVYMRDTQKSIDYLDFWIDSVQHMNLCKVYVKGLKQSLVQNEKYRDSLKQQETAEKRISQASAETTGSRSSSMLLDLLMKNDLLEGKDSHRLSAFLRGETSVRTSDPVVTSKIRELQRRSVNFDADPDDSDDNLDKPGERTSKINPEMVETFIQDSKTGPQQPPQQPQQQLQLQQQSQPSSTHFVSRAALRKSSQNIMTTYFLDNSDKRILIPDDIRQRVIHSIQMEGRDDPEVFDESREYVFKAMEHEAYPSFLRDNAMCNVTQRSSVVRTFLGILCAFAAFWTGYTLIFLDYRPKPVRAVVTIPFFFASYLLFSALYRIDPLLCLLGYGESKAGNSGFVKLEEPFVKKLLRKRALFVLFLICLTAAAFSILFALVPGKRLHH